MTDKNTVQPATSKKSPSVKSHGTSGRVIQFRRGRKTFKPRHFLIEIPSVNIREKAQEFVGKIVKWKSQGKNAKIITGKISSAHGGNGVVRAIFERGLPGQAIGTEVEIN